MHSWLLSIALIFSLASASAQAQQGAFEPTEADLKAVVEQSAPQREAFIICLSDMVDDSRARGVDEDAFIQAFPATCPSQRDAYRKALADQLMRFATGADHDRIVTGLTNLIYIPLANEFIGHSPYRYRLKDQPKNPSETPEEGARSQAIYAYQSCVTSLADEARLANQPSSDFRAALENACLQEAEAVRQAEAKFWATWAKPPSPETAGRSFIRHAKSLALRRHSAGGK